MGGNFDVLDRFWLDSQNFICLKKFLLAKADIDHSSTKHIKLSACQSFLLCADSGITMYLLLSWLMH